MQFDTNETLQKHRSGLALIPQVEEIIDTVTKDGYKNIFFIGIGGTVLYANQLAIIAKHLGSTLPLYVENAADFSVAGNPLFSKDSVVFIESVSGDTPEVVSAVDRARKSGARIIGYVERENCPLAERSDYLVMGKSASFYYWYACTLRLLKNAGQFDQYDDFMSDLQSIPEALVQVQLDMEPKAETYVEQYMNEPITYLVGSGNLEDWATCFGMCYMEEMQWMRTRPISASNFFHGTLEVIDRDTPVIVVKGEDITRPLTERVERFVHRVSAKVTVIDTKDFKLEGIRKEFRGMLSPLVVSAAFDRVGKNLAWERRHPAEIRRYYRRLDY